MSVEQRNSPKLLMGIMGALVTVVALVLLYQWLNASSGKTESELHQQDMTAVPTAKPAAKTKEETDTINTAQALETKVLIDDSQLKAPVPENAALAKEEIAKLDDLQVQLNEQKATLDAQHHDADQLIQLKEEQIKLLEAQLAQSQ